MRQQVMGAQVVSRPLPVVGTDEVVPPVAFSPACPASGRRPMPASKNVTRILSSASVMCSDVPGKAAQLITASPGSVWCNCTDYECPKHA
jgi:hypothetical protein